MWQGGTELSNKWSSQQVDGITATVLRHHWVSTVGIGVYEFVCGSLVIGDSIVPQSLRVWSTE